EQGSSGPQGPGNSHRCRSAQQVYQIIIQQAAAFKNRTQQAIDDGAEEAGKNDGPKLAYRNKTCSDGCNGYARRTEHSSDGPKEADASVSPCCNGFEVGNHQRF